MSCAGNAAKEFDGGKSSEDKCMTENLLARHSHRRKIMMAEEKNFHRKVIVFKFNA